jgi:hypothetical protein
MPMEMSMKSRRELTEITARRYRLSNRVAKGQILSEFCRSTGYNRAYSAMLLRAYRRPHLLGQEGTAVRLIPTKGHSRGGGRPPQYDAQVYRVVENLWRRLGYPCGKRLAPVLRRWIKWIRADRFLHPSAKVCKRLMTISPATIDRVLKPTRERLRLKGLSHTNCNPTLQQLIPVRTFGDFSHVPPRPLSVGHRWSRWRSGIRRVRVFRGIERCVHRLDRTAGRSEQGCSLDPTSLG